MARKPLDQTGNEPMAVQLGKINDNFVELYAADSSNVNWSGETVTASGAGVFGSLKLDTGTKTATATAGAATLNKDAGVITTEALTTAAGATYTLTLTNSSIAAADQVFASLAGGSNSAGVPVISQVVPAAGSVDVTVHNLHAEDALNGTLKIAFAVFKN